MPRAGITLVVCVAIVGCGSSDPDGVQNSLSGSVTVGGQPAQYGMITAVGPDGKEVSGPRLADGSYRIVDPPTGLLKFKFAGGPPPPPGGGAAKSGTGNIPKQYLTTNNELRFDFQSGNQKYDIGLKP